MISNTYSTTASEVIQDALLYCAFFEIRHIKIFRKFTKYKTAVSINVDSSAKLILACLTNLIGRSLRLFVKIQWRRETEQSCVENQVKPSLEDQEDVE